GRGVGRGAPGPTGATSARRACRLHARARRGRRARRRLRGNARSCSSLLRRRHRHLRCPPGGRNGTSLPRRAAWVGVARQPLRHCRARPKRAARGKPRAGESLAAVRKAELGGRDDRLGPTCASRARQRRARFRHGPSRGAAVRASPTGAAARARADLRRARGRRRAARRGQAQLAPTAQAAQVNSRTITVVASELLGRAGTGGAGTADSLLAAALGRHGHRVRLLVARGRAPATLTPEWAQRYDDANVEIRMLERTRGVSPAFLAPTLEVFHALRDDPPEVVIADDWRGLGFAALRARQTALSLPDTAFVIHCHGPGRVLAEFAQKVPDTLNRFGEEVTERTSIELADAVVSPTAWLLDWMRTHSWPVPES